MNSGTGPVGWVESARPTNSREDWWTSSTRPTLQQKIPAAVAVVLSLVMLTWMAPRVGRGQVAGVGEGVDLQSVAFDRITLKDNTVLKVEPVHPRPLPPIESAKSRNAPAPSPKPETKARSADDDPTRVVVIHALEGEVRDFKVKRTDIKEIVYFEDMLLAQGDRLEQAGDFTRAFEYYLAVQTRNPAWEGIGSRVERLLFDEGAQALLGGDYANSLRLLRLLQARRSDYPGLRDRLAQAYAGQITRVFRAGNYAEGRRFLHELETLAPDTVPTQRSRDLYIERARDLASAAEKASGAERLDNLTQALQIWPSLEGVAEKYAEAFRAEPTLEVAVSGLPREVTPFLHSPADERVVRLVYLPILARADEQAAQGQRPGQLAASLEKQSLGRRLVVTIRPGLTWSDGSRPVSAIDVLRSLADRTDPRSPGYNARWSLMVERIEAPSADRVEVRLSRSPLKPEDWLLWPVGPAHADWDGLVPTPGAGRRSVGDSLYIWEGASNDPASTLFRISPTAGSTPQPSIRRIREREFRGPSGSVTALTRGDVSLIDHVPPDQVADLSHNSEVRVGLYTQPRLHLIALDGRNPTLRQRALRRALSLAIDRKDLLERVILQGPASDLNQVLDGPFAQGSYAEAKDTPPLVYDRLLARMLAAAASKELEVATIRLTLDYPALPEVLAVIPRIVDAFHEAGIEVTPRRKPPTQLEDELRAGRPFELAYRVIAATDPAWGAGPLLCPGYDAPPDSEGLSALLTSPRILQLLLELEQAPELPTAREVLARIDREAHDELPILPLWQLADHYAWRTRLTGPADSADDLYQGIEAWQVAPWFPRDPW